MNINGVSNYRHRKSPSSDRFLGLYTLSTPLSSSTDFSDHELTEADLFWTGLTNSSDSTRFDSRRNLTLRRHDDKSGILAALPDDCGNRVPTPFRPIPKPPHRVTTELTQSAPCRKFQHSAPVDVPIAMKKMKKPKRFGGLDVFSEERENENENENEDEEEEELLPPHEIVAMKLKTTSSMLEGVGRTLKGRDLRQVRNAVWRQTGFID